MPLNKAQAAITIRKLKFSRWTAWSEREGIDVCGNPGVYVIGLFGRMPSGSVVPLDRNVVYIGETVKRSLRTRWSQFDRSAYHRGRRHSGGMTFRRDIVGTWKRLHVAGVAFDLEGEHASAYIRAVERMQIWDYVSAHGKLPVCNTM